MIVNEEQWKKYEEKFGKLLHTISKNINGDPMIASHEDNYADLCIAALESIKGFKKKTGRDFDEFIDSKLFSGYTKTCVWNFKCSKGNKLKARYGLRNRSVSSDNLDFIDIEDSSINLNRKNFLDFDEDIGDGFSLLGLDQPVRNFSLIDTFDLVSEIRHLSTQEQKLIVDFLIKNPNQILSTGKVKLSQLSQHLNFTEEYTAAQLERLKTTAKGIINE